MFKKFIEFAMGNGIVLLIGLLSSPIVTRMINPEEMGKFSIFNTVTNLLLLVLVFGLDQSYVRYYYEENEANRGKLFRRALKWPLIINILTAILILIFYKPVSYFIISENSFFLAVLIIIHLFGSILSRFSLLQVRMRQRAKLYSLLNIIMKITYLIVIFILYYVYHDNYLTVVLATIISNIIIVIISLSVEYRECFMMKGNEELNTSTYEMFKYGFPFIFSMAITWLFQSIDRVSIKEFSGYLEVGLYSGAMTIISLLNACQSTFTTFWVPVAYEKYSTQPGNKEFFIKMNKIVTVFMLFCAIGLIATKDIIVLLLGEKYRESVFIFPFLVFMPIMYTISETTVVGINFMKKTNSHIYIALISATVNIILNFILVPILGARGAAISTGIAYIVFFLARTFISNRYYKINFQIKKFILSTLLVYILATYSSFFTFDFNVFIMTLVCIISIIFMYREVFYDLITLIKNRRKENNE